LKGLFFGEGYRKGGGLKDDRENESECILDL